MTAHPSVRPTLLPDWSRIGTVCLDMDGTVLDHRFDNRLWLEELPRRWGEREGLTHGAALRVRRDRFDARRGSLEFYCVDHWSRELGFDIEALKHELRDEIRYLDGAAEFLGRLRAARKRVLLATNAHPVSLAVKNLYSGLGAHFDALVSAHELGVPKEDPEFWPRLARAHGVHVQDTLFADDNPAVLRAAVTAGVALVYAVLQPDSTRPPHPAVPGVPGVLRLAELGDSLPAQPSAPGPLSLPPGGVPSV
ncbi:MAG: HAD-IA family hydrolase [Steroidobacteraceae bacterium]